MGSNTLKAIIIDDEHNAQLNLKALCNTYIQEVEIIALASSIQEAKNLLSQESVDIIFLDISMPGGSGFQLVEDINTEKQALIFVTAYEEYALQAFKSKAWYYLTKPIDIDELIAIMTVIKQRLELIRHVASVAETENQNENQIIIHNHNGFHLVNLENVLFLEAKGNYCVFSFQDAQANISSKQLGHYEKLLPKYFLKVHRSFIINLRFVKGFSNTNGYEVLLHNNAKIPISKSHIKDFMAAVEQKTKS